jgi:hypothetical protein
MKLLTIPCLVLYATLLISCDLSSRFGSGNPVSSPIVEQSPVLLPDGKKLNYEYSAIGDGEALVKAVSLYHNAGKNMALYQIKQCKKYADPEQLAKYNAVLLLLKDGDVVCYGTSSLKGFYYNVEDAWEAQNVENIWALVQISLAIDSNKIGVIMESKKDGKVNVMVGDNFQSKASGGVVN